MSMSLPKPPKASIVYEDAHVVACLAFSPLAKGHTVIAWKRRVRDLHLLSCEEYEYLMDIVDVVRDALLKLLRIRKVYLVYMDEAQQVHWHLVPRFNERGYNVFRHTPKRVRTFPLAPKLRTAIQEAMAHHREFRGGEHRPGRGFPIER